MFFNSVKSIPCTACRYCVEGCPQGIPIPDIFAARNRQTVWGQLEEGRKAYREILEKGPGADACVRCGKCVSTCPQKIQVIEELEKEGSTLSIAHYDMRFAKPLDENLLQEIASRCQRIVTIEDGSVAGGFGSAVMEWMSDHGHTPVIRRLGLPDHFIEHGKVSELQQLAGIDPASIKQTILSL